MHLGIWLPSRCALALLFFHAATFTLLPNCPPECICLSQTQVLCNSGGLQEIPKKLLPPSVEHLSLTRNNFPIIKSDSFSGLRYLKKLSLDGNNISIIKPFAFRGLPRLKELSIQETPLATVAQFAFAGLQNISAIYLSHNKIKKVESYAFAGTSNLRMLVLTSNPLYKIEQHAFSGLNNVERINLPSVPECSKNCEVLIKGERVEQVNEFVYLGSKFTRDGKYDSDIKRRVLPGKQMNGALYSLINSQKVSKKALLSVHKGIRVIEPDAFDGLDTVGNIKLAFMDLPSLSTGIFRGLTNIGVFSIQESDLGIIDGSAFNGMTFIRTFNILNNKIDAIEYFNITEEQKIGHLKFQGNHILEIPKSDSLLIEVDKLTVISNHFPCNCHIHSLLEGPLTNGSVAEFVSKNYCISPLEVNGLPMSSLDVEAIGRCEEEVTKGNLEASKDATNMSHRFGYGLSKGACFVLIVSFVIR